MAKKIDTSTIVIKKIIVHSIPKHKKGDYSIEPQFSEHESIVSDELKLFFKDKVIQSLNSKRELKICFDPNNESPVSTYINEIINSNGNDFVEKSKLITKYLHSVQVGYNASGILVIVLAEVNNFNTCIILKLERDKGAQLILDADTKTYNIEAVKDLMLTEKTRIYKVGLFMDRNDLGIDFDGVLADLQINIKSKKEITTWFMKKFLGCLPYEDPGITTHKFYNYTTTFIQSNIDDEIKKVKYIQDLNSYIQKNTNTLSALDFANDYMATEDKDYYRNYLIEKKFKMSSFIKDTSKIDSKIKKIIITFDSNISIIGAKGSFEGKVKLKELENGEHKAEIISKIKSIK